MSGQHTQARLAARDEWLVPEDQVSRPIGGSADKVKDREHYANIVTTVNGKYHDNRANARRLAACWNIAEGMPTKEIEQGTPLVNVRDKMNAQAKELAIARTLLACMLKEAEGWHDECRGTLLDSGIAEEARAFLKGGE